jgi:uncharacterized protein YrzB (UPF0473 family)
MMGRFAQIDTEQNLLTLTDMMGGTWLFDYTTQVYPAETSNSYRMMVLEVKIANDGSEQSEIAYYKYDLDNPEATQSHFQPGDIVMIVWRDKRKLVDIEGVIPLSVIPKGNGLLPIRKIVREGE